VAIGFITYKHKPIQAIMNKSLLAIVVALGLLISCESSTSEELAQEIVDKVTNEVESVVRNFMDANTLTASTHIGLRADTEGYVYAGDGDIVYRDYDSYQSGVSAAFEGIEKFTELQITDIYTYVLAANAASCTAKFNGEFLAVTGDTIVHNGCWTFVLKKFDDTWLVVQENGTHTH